MRGEPIHIDVRSSELYIQELREFVCADSAGGTVIFEGTVRNSTSGKDVIRLEFEAYLGMALKELKAISSEALEEYEVYKVGVQHRTGILGIGETAVIVAVSAAHRKAAFEACQYIMDELKTRVPIWKKEVFSDGEVWVAAHP